jgi:menaquinone-9 beta-reductase
VVVADALIPPIDKACGEGLMPDSCRNLLRLGVGLGGGREFSGIQFANRRQSYGDVATATFSDGNGVGVRRVDLHRQLLEHAEAVGVRLKWGHRVDLGEAPASAQKTHRFPWAAYPVSVGGEVYRFRYLIGADGDASRVRRWAGLESGSLRSQRLAFRRHYRITPWSDFVEVHWSALGQVYVTPVAENEVCIAAITRQRGVNFDIILEGMPYLQNKLRGQVTVGRDRGASTTTRSLRRVTRGNIALAGDASGSVDAITGSGLASAFREALLLGDALGRDAIADYEAEHVKVLQFPRAMASMMLSMDCWPGWRDRIIRILASSPDLFSSLLAMHIGERSMARFAATQGARAGYRLLLSEFRARSFQRQAFQLPDAVNVDVSAEEEAVDLEVCQPIA